jgi:hypothetical protein
VFVEQGEKSDLGNNFWVPDNLVASITCSVCDEVYSVLAGCRKIAGSTPKSVVDDEHSSVTITSRLTRYRDEPRRIKGGMIRRRGPQLASIL